jgi:hypothetical protein
MYVNSLFRDLAEKFVAAHHATARLWQPAPPSPKHTLHPCPLSLMEPDCTCDEIGPFRAAPRSRRESTSRRRVKWKGCAAGWHLAADHHSLGKLRQEPVGVLNLSASKRRPTISFQDHHHLPSSLHATFSRGAGRSGALRPSKRTSIRRESSTRDQD